MIKITGSSCWLLSFLNAWNYYITKYRNTLHSHYFVVRGAGFWTTGRFRVIADCRCILHRAIILSSKYYNISKGKCDILEILILLFNFCFFMVNFCNTILYINLLIILNWFFSLIFSNKYIINLITKEKKYLIWYCKALFYFLFLPK